MAIGRVELTLVIPAYNEAENITLNIEELDAWVTANLSDTTTEILVIDDGSTDGTGKVLEEYATTHRRVRVVRHVVNKGRGQAIRTGFDSAHGDYIITLDADLSYAPDHIPALLAPLQRDEADITLASAYHPQGSVSNVPWTRAVLSRWGNRVLSAGVYGQLRTVTCMVRGYRRQAVEQLELVNTGKDLHLEILQKANLFGLRIREIPAHLRWRDRKRRAISKRRLIDHIPFLSMSGTIASHLVYSYVLRPGSLLLLPVLGLFAISLIGGIQILTSWISKLVAAPNPMSFSTAFYTLREAMLQGSLTLQIIIVSLLVSLIFLAFYFASQQSKRSFDETYILLNRMNQRLKRLEKERGG